MWTAQSRRIHDRSGLRYPTDMTDAEWELIRPHIRPGKRGGGRRKTDERSAMEAILYLLGTGCQWRALPKDFPPYSTVFGFLKLWEWDGTLRRLHDALYATVREQAGRKPSPTSAIIDSQSVRGGEKGGPASIRRATTRARKSRARSATSSPTRSGYC